MDIGWLLVVGAFALLLAFGRWALVGTVGARSATRWGALAGAAAALSAAVFLVEAGLYGVHENGPVYYPFSPYIEYREASEWLGALYAFIAGALVLAAGRLRPVRHELGLVAGGLACLAIALPAVVPALLPRSEYGVDAVFYSSSGGTVDLETGQPSVCFTYGVQRLDDEPREPAPGLCLGLRDDAAGRAVVEDPGSLSDERASIYDFQAYLNESGLRPYQRPGRFELKGAQVVSAVWSGPGVPAPQRVDRQEIAKAQRAVPRGARAQDALAKRDLARLVRRVRGCGQREGTFEGCEPSIRGRRDLLRVGIFYGAGEGEVEVTSTSPTTFMVTSHSYSATSWSFAVDDSGREVRTCALARAPGCSAGGRWRRR